MSMQQLMVAVQALESGGDDMPATPATAVVALLIALRDEGLEFDDAWKRAMRVLPRIGGGYTDQKEERAEWVRALRGSRKVFKREWEAGVAAQR